MEKEILVEENHPTTFLIGSSHIEILYYILCKLKMESENDSLVWTQDVENLLEDTKDI
jgi:hypothetical protein